MLARAGTHAVRIRTDDAEALLPARTKSQGSVVANDYRVGCWHRPSWTPPWSVVSDSTVMESAPVSGLIPPDITRYERVSGTRPSS